MELHSGGKDTYKKHADYANVEQYLIEMQVKKLQVQELCVYVCVYLTICDTVVSVSLIEKMTFD